MKKNAVSEKISAVVVTHNRKELLRNCLNGILRQTVPVNHIFIIDNDSKDGTEDMIRDKFGDNQLVEYRNLGKNTGSAGGFHEGVKMAYERGSEWIWLMDDDVTPRPDCLEKMKSYGHISKCINANKVDPSNKEYEFMFEVIFDPSICRMTFMNNISFKNGKDFAFVNVGCFEGMLIHRDIVAQIGFPDKRFFIYSDDTTYGFIASLYTNVIFVRDAYFDKKVSFKNTATPIFSYYAIRNQFLLKEYLKKYGIYNARLFYLGIALFAGLAATKQAVRSRDIKIPWYVLRGLFDGLRGKFYQIGTHRK